MRIVIIILAIVVVLLVAAYFAAGLVVYRQLADVRGRCDKHLANRPDLFTNVSEWPVELDFSPYFVPSYDDVRFPSRQAGLQIAGWYLEGDAGAPAVIMVEGLGGCRHGQAALLPAGMLWHNGFSVLAIDLRDTGESDTEDGFTSVGNEEYLDVLGAWDWLVQEKGHPEDHVGVMGNSLGAAAVLIAFQEEPRLAAIALNSPFANLSQIMQEELGRAGFPGFIAPATVIMARILNGEDLLEHNPLDAIQAAGDRPVFVVHSRDDPRIGVHHSQQLEAAAKEVGADATFWYIDGADHVQGPGVYPEEFEARITEFFGTELNR